MEFGMYCTFILNSGWTWISYEHNMLGFKPIWMLAYSSQSQKGKANGSIYQLNCLKNVTKIKDEFQSHQMKELQRSQMCRQVASKNFTS